MAHDTHRRKPTPVPIKQAQVSLFKLGVSRFDLRDPYHLAVSLSWPAFVLVLLGGWLAINVLFGLLYLVSPNDIANARPWSFSDVFFFSIETLATVGYGVMAPATLYGHIVSAAEIVTGTAFTAIVTGLLFVRFSRPKAKIVYADDAVVASHNNRTTLMLRFSSARVTLMTGAQARMFVLLGEHTAEGKFYRRIHELTLVQSHLPLFVLPWTVLHVIDEESPLRGLTADTLHDLDIRLFLTLEARDQALAAIVHDMKFYDPAHIIFGMRYADCVVVDEAGNATADLDRISLLEPDLVSTEALDGFRLEDQPQPHSA